MSVKFEKETIQQTGGMAGTQGPTMMKGAKHPIADEIGTALTGGKANVGTKGYLAAYLDQLQKNPLRTKMLTTGGLSAAQELLASWIAKDRNRNGSYFTSRVPKMAAYGAFISAPLGHVLIGILQRMFAGRTSLKAKILQILVSNLVIAPITNSAYLVSMAIIAGARTIHQVHATWRAGFMPVMKETWVPFFNLVSFFIGTYINSETKKKRIAALKRQYERTSGRPEDYPRPGMGGLGGPEVGTPGLGGQNPPY